jgi:hypothetical protein
MPLADPKMMSSTSSAIRRFITGHDFIPEHGAARTRLKAVRYLMPSLS